MNEHLQKAISEYEAIGRLTPTSAKRVRQELLGPDCYDAINIAGDCQLREFAPEIATAFRHPKPMVRWLAVSVVLGRFKVPRFALEGLELAKSESSPIVRGEALASLGLVLPLIEEKGVRNVVAQYLLDVASGATEESEMRQDAYVGILHSLDYEDDLVDAMKRGFNPTNCIEPAVLSAFVSRYCFD